MSNTIKETINPNPEMEYHLRAIGIVDRADYRIIASDNRVFTDGVIVAQPDFVLLHRSGAGIVLSYKSRNFSGQITTYEKVQLHAELMAVRTELAVDLATHPELPPMQLAIMYGDHPILGVDYDESLEKDIYDVVFDAIDQMKINGIYDEDRETIESSKLARYFVDPWFEDEAFNKPEQAREGTYIHQAIQHSPGGAGGGSLH